MKKKLLVFLLCVTMSLPLMACNSGTDLPHETQVTNTEYDETEAPNAFESKDIPVACVVCHRKKGISSIWRIPFG